MTYTAGDVEAICLTHGTYGFCVFSQGMPGLPGEKGESGHVGLMVSLSGPPLIYPMVSFI